MVSIPNFLWQPLLQRHRAMWRRQCRWLCAVALRRRPAPHARPLGQLRHQAVPHRADARHVAQLLNRSFLAVFVGTALACIALALSALPGWRGPGAGLRLAGALLYLLGTIAVTRACNIPRNDALAALQPDDPAAVAQWTQYIASWTAWNHVRTLAAVLAAAALVWSTRLARP